MPTTIMRGRSGTTTGPVAGPATTAGASPIQTTSAQPSGSTRWRYGVAPAPITCDQMHST
jgi:hypothetical protein